MIFQQRPGRVATRTFQFGPQTGLVRIVGPCLVFGDVTLWFWSLEKPFAFLCSGIAKHIFPKEKYGEFLISWGSEKKIPMSFCLYWDHWSRSGRGKEKIGKNSPNTKKTPKTGRFLETFWTAGRGGGYGPKKLWDGRRTMLNQQLPRWWQLKYF